MTYLIVAIIGSGCGLTLFVVGERIGFRRGLSLANLNNSNLVAQLKEANSFATELRNDEKTKREELAPLQEMN